MLRNSIPEITEAFKTSILGWQPCPSQAFRIAFKMTCDLYNFGVTTINNSINNLQDNLTQSLFDLYNELPECEIRFSKHNKGKNPFHTFLIFKIALDHTEQDKILPMYNELNRAIYDKSYGHGEDPDFTISFPNGGQFSSQDGIFEFIQHYIYSNNLYTQDMCLANSFTFSTIKFFDEKFLFSQHALSDTRVRYLSSIFGRHQCSSYKNEQILQFINQVMPRDSSVRESIKILTSQTSRGPFIENVGSDAETSAPMTGSMRLGRK